jgi:hypothetical protein
MRPKNPNHFQTTGQNSNFFFEQIVHQNQGQPGIIPANSQNFFDVSKGKSVLPTQSYTVPISEQSQYRQSDPVKSFNTANYHTPNFANDVAKAKPQNILQTHIGQRLPLEVNDQRKKSSENRPEPLQSQVRYTRGEDSGMLNLPGVNQGGDSFNRLDNISMYTDKRSNSFSRLGAKSPLNTFVMDTQNKRPLSRNSSRQSISENEDSNTDSLPIDIEASKIAILSKDAEINYLKEQIASFEEKDKHALGGNQLGNDARVIAMEHELQDLTVKNRYLRDEMDKLRGQVDRQSQEYQSKLASMKTRFDENAKKNMDMYERELVFKHNNNPEENMKYLKERIMELERRLKIKNPTFV